MLHYNLKLLLEFLKLQQLKMYYYKLCKACLIYKLLWICYKRLLALLFEQLIRQSPRQMVGILPSSYSIKSIFHH